MRFLLISVFLLSLTSCKLLTTNGFAEEPVVTHVYKNLYFSDINLDYVYKSNIEVYGRHFGGIIVIKKIDADHHRVVFTTEFGSKIFDFEFAKGAFKVNFILEDLNKKIVVNTLKKDFKLLLQESNSVKKKYENSQYTVYQSQHKKRYNFYFVNRESNSLEKLINTSKTKEKVIVTYKSAQKILADKILIDHQNIKLKIDLRYLESN